MFASPNFDRDNHSLIFAKTLNVSPNHFPQLEPGTLIFPTVGRLSSHVQCISKTRARRWLALGAMSKAIGWSREYYEGAQAVNFSDGLHPVHPQHSQHYYQHHAPEPVAP